MKSIYLFEAETANNYRENIVKERLVYLKYLLDNTKNKKERTDLERIYQCLYNLNYDVNGKLRTLNDMYTYINRTMTENKGIIPGLPTNEQIVTIDEKASAFKNIHKSEFQSYLANFEKSNLDKVSTKTDDDAKNVLSPEHPEDNKKALEEIRKISSIFGLTNIIGLEPKRQASQEDIKRKEELKKQQQDGDPDAAKRDQEDAKKITNKKPEPEQQIGGEDTTKKPENNNQDETTNSDDFDDPDEDPGQLDDDEELMSLLLSIADEFMDDMESDEFNEDEFNKWMDEQDIETELDIPEEDKEEFRSSIMDVIKNQLEDEDSEDSDSENQNSDNEKESNQDTSEHITYKQIQNVVTEAEDFNLKDMQRAQRISNRAEGTKTLFKDGIHAKAKAIKKIKKKRKWAELVHLMPLRPIGKIKQKKVERRLAGMQNMVDEEKDPKRKKELQKTLDNMKRTCISKHGRIRMRPKFKSLPKEERAKFKEIYKKQIKHNRHLRKDGKAYIQVNPGFKDRVAAESKYLKKADDKHEKMAEKETSVIDKDGSEIIARKKKNGKGSTYVRKKNGKEIGYATRDEFIAAKGQNNKPKESFKMKSLYDYILESTH